MPAHEYCDSKYWLAYSGNKIVGRVAAIINHKANERWNEKKVRFGWFDFIENIDVCQKLLEKVEEFGRQNGMTEIHGPLSFTDMDGTVTHYRVAAMDILEPTAVDVVTSGEFDLTLFTCTYGGKSRVTIRCDETGLWASSDDGLHFGEMHEWCFENGEFVYRVTVPQNTEAKVFFPLLSGKKSVNINGLDFFGYCIHFKFK